MATATQWGYARELDTAKRSSASCHFEDALRQKIVGDEAVEALVELHQVLCAGLRSPGRPETRRWSGRRWKPRGGSFRLSL
jgi:hypothetical protein